MKHLILVTYQNRSGSTLLLNLFSRDKNLTTCPEAEILIDLLLSSPSKRVCNASPSILELLENDKKLISWGLPTSIYKSNNHNLTYFDLFLNIISAYKNTRAPNSQVILFKGTNISKHYEKIKNLCESKGIKTNLIRIIRDPRAIWASQKRTISPTTNRKMSENPLDVARSWSCWIEQTSKYNDIITLKYEDLILKGEDEFSLLCKQLELDFKIDYPSGTHYNNLTDEHKNIHPNITKPLDQERITAWSKELSKYSICTIEKICREQMVAFNYELICHKKPAGFKMLLFSLRVFSKIRFLRGKLRLVYKKNPLV
jgi:hypothetical protein